LLIITDYIQFPCDEFIKAVAAELHNNNGNSNKNENKKNNSNARVQNAKGSRTGVRTVTTSGAVGKTESTTTMTDIKRSVNQHQDREREA
jgi:hypothetical protein